MEKTTIEEKMQIKLKDPILIEGLPGLGMVGNIAMQYLIKQLKAKKFAKLYSPHFPYYVIVTKGSVRLLSGDFLFSKNPLRENDLMFFTGDSQPQTIEGQYEVANYILDFAKRNNVKRVLTIGGYRKEVKDKPKVVAASTNQDLFKDALRAKAIASPAGNPIVGTAGLLLGLAKFKGMDAICLLGETRGYLPDPKAAKSVLEVLSNILGIKIDLGGLDSEIKKSKEVMKRMQEIEERRDKYAQKMRKMEEERITYIS